MSAFSSAGHFNDMDMLEVGRGLSKEEDMTHFAMWCMLNSPLMIGCNMSTINSTTKKLLTNADLIALNQDTLYRQGYVVDNQNGAYMLVRDVELPYDTMRVVAVYNPSDREIDYKIDFDKADLGGKVKMRSLTYGINLSKEYEGSYNVKVPAHATRVFRLDAQERKERTLYEAETAYLSQYHEDGKENARFYSADAASGGVKVGYLGNRPENDLQWRNVYSKNGGKYKCTIDYLVEGTRSFTMEVNGENPVTYSVSGTSWNRIGSKSCEIELHPGENVIRLYSTGSDYCPDIDCMKLELLDDPDFVPAATQNPQSNDKIIDLEGHVINNLDNLPAGTIYIQNHEKKIK